MRSLGPSFTARTGAHLERVILVGGGCDGQATPILVDEPGPSAAEARSTSGVELALHLVQRAKGAVDGGLKIRGWPVVVAWLAHDLPEEGVVVVATTIVAVITHMAIIYRYHESNMKLASAKFFSETAQRTSDDQPSQSYVHNESCPQQEITLRYFNRGGPCYGSEDAQLIPLAIRNIKLTGSR